MPKLSISGGWWVGFSITVAPKHDVLWDFSLHAIYVFIKA